MSPDQFAEQIVSKYGEPYTRDAKSLSYLHRRCFEAASIYEEWGCAPEMLLGSMKGLFDIVVYANMNLLLDSGFNTPLAPEHTYISPVLDFRNPHCIDEDNDVLQYHVKLENLAWEKVKGYGCADQSGHEIIMRLPIYYDIWLQIVVGWDRPASLISEQLEDKESM